MYEAYKKGEWAFVSDYARLDIIYNNGYIYLDTDVELIKSPDNLLNTEGFAGIDCANNGFSVLSAGLGFGAVKNNKTIRILLDAYNNLKFINEDGSIKLTPCPAIQSKTLKEYGFVYISE